MKCVADPSQSYSLYLPSNYSPDRQWSVLIAFHPAARGRAFVEKYKAAAEQYGYVVAGSNNSRNGPWAVSLGAVRAMLPDLDKRFTLNPKRLYLTGFSGGARVALNVALANNLAAGVIASGGGYPDSQPRSKVGFAVFGTAGTEDFNYIEMRTLDRKLTTPHRLAVFPGGHMLPPDEVALEAIEWMELQAMKSGVRARDEPLIDRLFKTRQQRISESSESTETVHLLEAVVADFGGLRDISSETRRLEELVRQRDVKKALDRERSAEETEMRAMREFADLEATLADESRRTASLMTLRDRLSKLSKKAGEPTESPERSQARRMLRAVTAGAAGRVQDRDYLLLLQEFGRSNSRF